MSDELRDLLDPLKDAAREAGEEILKIVRQGFEVQSKSDSSPVTEADHAAEAVILRALVKAAPGVPVIAEEEASAGRIPTYGDEYFLVDPLDGTREFARGGGDYTVNIGLIRFGSPVLGIVLAPATGSLYVGCAGVGAQLEASGSTRPIHVRPRGPIPVAVASKSHLNQATVDYLTNAVGECEHISIGSSLKFCLLAEGAADIYPRLSPTSEWDTAAGHAILVASGGRVYGVGGGALQYGKKAFLNRAFVGTSGWVPPPLDPWLDEFAGDGYLPKGI